MSAGDISASTPMMTELIAQIEQRRAAALADLDALANEVDAARLLVALLADFGFIPEDQHSEMTVGTIPAKAELLAYQLIPAFGRSANALLTPWHVQRGRTALESLFTAMQQRRLFREPVAEEGEAERDRELLLGHIAAEAAMVRGSAYPEQTAREIAEIQGQFEGRFAQFTGVGPGRAVAITFALVRSIEDRFNAMLPELRATAHASGERWRLLRRRQRHSLNADERDFLARFSEESHARHFGFLSVLADLAPDRLPVDRGDLLTEAPVSEDEWVAYCGLIGCNQDTRSAMTAAIEMRDRPVFILPDGRVFMVDGGHALDQLWVAFERSAQEADRRWFTGPYARHKGVWLEEQLVVDLGRVFPANQIYRTLDYPDPDHSESRTAELDVAVSWPPFLILAEAKAKQFRLAGQLGDRGRLRSDMQANVEDAFEQARRARRYIESTEEARFTERGSGRVLVVRRDAIRRTYLMAVSQHTLAMAVTRLASFRPLGLFRSDEYPWALSIADLDIVTQFCPGPDVLLHYVERRLALQREQIDLHGDELDLFGAYLDTRLQAAHLWERGGQRADTVALFGYQEPFDAMMGQRRGERRDAPAVRLDVPDEIAAVLDALRGQATSEHGRWIAFSLLQFSDRALATLANFLAGVRQQTPPPGGFRRATYGEDDWVVTVVATADRSPDDLDQHTTLRAAIEKYRRKATRSIGFGIVTGDLTRPFECVAYADNPWDYDPGLERAIAEESPPLAINMGAGQWPGRNAPCPCGSGKKFKRCCLPKIDAARRGE